jgi:hypothetical protein
MMTDADVGEDLAPRGAEGWKRGLCAALVAIALVCHSV